MFLANNLNSSRNPFPPSLVNASRLARPFRPAEIDDSSFLEGVGAPCFSRGELDFSPAEKAPAFLKGTRGRLSAEEHRISAVPSTLAQYDRDRPAERRLIGGF
jgi:hypothetical protein